jgi:acyl-CoA thioester hydrolase
MPLLVPTEIRFSDIDKFGHVNNAKYLTFLEQARIVYFDRIIASNNEWVKTGIILAKAEIDFIQPILFEDKISVEIAVCKIGNKSFDVNYQIFKQAQTMQLMAKAMTVMVCFDYKLNKSISIPEHWKKNIVSFEKLHS